MGKVRRNTRPTRHRIVRAEASPRGDDTRRELAAADFGGGSAVSPGPRWDRRERSAAGPYCWGTVARNCGGRRTRVACSHEYARESSLASCHFLPMKETPTGRPEE